MDGSLYQRRAPRIMMQVYTEYECARLRGEGLTANLSTSGALVDDASRTVADGTLLSVRFSLFLSSFGVPFQARVVRQTPGGFAVRFVGMQPIHRGILEEALPPWAVDAAT